MNLCNVLALVLPANARVYATLQDRARLGGNGLKLRVMVIHSDVTVSSSGGGGGGGDEGVHGAGVRRFAWFCEMSEKSYLQYNSDSVL